jgi:hypothetical protein
MNALAHRSKLASGIFVTIAVLCSGCAGGLAANHTPMSVVDLDSFVIDCKVIFLTKSETVILAGKLQKI